MGRKLTNGNQTQLRERMKLSSPVKLRIKQILETKIGPKDDPVTRRLSNYLNQRYLISLKGKKLHTFGITEG